MTPRRRGVRPGPMADAGEGADMPERTCQECGEQLPWLPKRKYCEPCNVEVIRRRAREFYHKRRRREGHPAQGAVLEAVCKYCEATFTYTLKVSRRTVCDACNKKMSGQARAAWVKRNPERVREAKWRYRKNNPDGERASREAARFTKYGVTRQWYEEQIDRQDGRCANKRCGATEPGGRHNTWHIDHDHVSGQVRGLLCNACNIAAGMACDDPDVLLGLSEYIRQHRQLRLVN